MESFEGGIHLQTTFNTLYQTKEYCQHKNEDGYPECVPVDETSISGQQCTLKGLLLRGGTIGRRSAYHATIATKIWVVLHQRPASI